MFTGIIEEVGTIESVRKGGGAFKLTVKCSKVLGAGLLNGTADGNASSSAAGGSPGSTSAGCAGSSIGGAAAGCAEVPTAIGDSISVNGICLTVTDISNSSFTADVMPETLSRTSLADARPGVKVDLERAMPAYGRFGGHIVSGHIDGTGRVVDIRKDGNAVWYQISADGPILDQIVEKGSVAIDGISLTVAKVTNKTFSVSVIPHTIEATILPLKKVGSIVNLETDVVGKYVQKMLAGSASFEAAASTDDRSLLDLL